jgi:hypothetical protein
VPLVDSRDYHDNNQEGTGKQPWGGRNSNERQQKKPSTSALPDRSSNKTLPAVLAIPKVMPAASCFYLTDGEGLSDSELHDEEEDDDDFHAMDERDDAAHHPQRG